MLEFKQIKELVELVAKHRLEGVELERSGFRLRIEGQATLALTTGAPAQAAVSQAVGGGSPAQAPPAAMAEAEEPADPHAGAHIVKSPIVGTFYRASSPDSAPFVEVGDRVDEGQVLCIVEAMKLMNEIESDAAGVVVEIFAANAQAVEFDEPLFAIKTD